MKRKKEESVTASNITSAGKGGVARGNQHPNFGGKKSGETQLREVTVLGIFDSDGKGTGRMYSKKPFLGK